MIEQERADARRAAAKAREILKVGDKITVIRAGLAARAYTFSGWAGDLIVTNAGFEISPIGVLKVNGVAVDFLDPPISTIFPGLSATGVALLAEIARERQAVTVPHAAAPAERAALVRAAARLLAGLEGLDASPELESVAA
jgi:hypothetical protein